MKRDGSADIVNQTILAHMFLVCEFLRSVNVCPLWKMLIIINPSVDFGYMAMSVMQRVSKSDTKSQEQPLIKFCSHETRSTSKSP